MVSKIQEALATKFFKISDFWVFCRHMWMADKVDAKKR